MKLTATLLCFLLSVAASTIYNTAKAQAVDVNDSLALVDLYNSTNGLGWLHNSNWLTTKPVKTWYGVGVTASRVVSLDLCSNQLAGPLPSSIGNLTQAFSLSLCYNSLTGVIPASIGNLVKLQYIELYNNQLTGTIPATIGNLVNLTGLYLYKNQLSGTIPAEIGNIANLRELYLFNNQLSGEIPAVIGSLTILSALELNNNQLSGTIPTTFGNLKKLELLLLENNHLSGTIPDMLGTLHQLRTLTLQHNQLTGTIPATFHKLKNLSYLDVSYNYLTQDENIHRSEDTKFTIVYINNNLFTFDGIEFIAKYYFNGVYAPQNTLLSIHQHSNTLSVDAGGTLRKNTYKWFKVGGSGSTDIKGDSTFTPPASGKYYAQVTNAIAKKLTLHTDTVDFTLPAVQKEGIIATAIPSKILNTKLIIYPNPTSNSIHLQTSGTADIILTNSTGKILLTKTISNTADINVSSYANGTYYIQNKTTGETQKIVIIH